MLEDEEGNGFFPEQKKLLASDNHRKKEKRKGELKELGNKACLDDILFNLKTEVE